MDEESACRRDLYLTALQTRHASGGIRTRNSSTRAAADTRLGPLDHRDRLTAVRIGRSDNLMYCLLLWLIVLECH